MTKREMNNFRRVLEARSVEFDSLARRRDAILIERTADDLDRMHGAVQRELAVRTLEAILANGASGVRKAMDCRCGAECTGNGGLN